MIASFSLRGRRRGVVAAVLLSLWTVRTPSVPAADAPRPLNVLFIVSDDMNCQLGCYGFDVAKTPNLNKLAAKGVRFDRAYCNYPVCNASRVSFLSGRYPNTTQVFGNGTDPRVALGPDFQFLPEHFKSQGYFIGAYGKIAHPTFAKSIKWDEHVEPQGRGGDASEGGQRARRQQRAAQAAKGKRGDDVPFAWAATANSDEQEPDGVTATNVVRMLEEHKDGPFFIGAGFHKPHVPHTAPAKYFDLHPVDTMPLPVEPKGHADHIPEIARAPNYFPNLTAEQQRQIIQHYHAATSFMDAQVGRIMDAMDRLNLWENTVVVFLGDHGWHLGEHGGYWAKMSLMRESALAPLIIVAPGKSTRAATSAVVQFIDIYPTVTELCRVKTPDGLEGHSLVPLIDDPQAKWSHPAYGVVSRGPELGRAVWTEEYSYLLWPDGSQQLFRYRSDPGEYTNLADDSQMGTVVADLKKQVEAGPAKTKGK